METKERKENLLIEAQVKNAENAKELLNDLETLLDKYSVTINLKIGQGLQEFYTLT